MIPKLFVENNEPVDETRWKNENMIRSPRDCQDSDGW